MRKLVTFVLFTALLHGTVGLVKVSSKVVVKSAKIVVKVVK